MIDNKQLTCFSEIVVYDLLGGIRIDSLTGAANEIVRCNVVEVSQKSADACVLQLRRQLHNNVQLISTQCYHNIGTYTYIYLCHT